MAFAEAAYRGGINADNMYEFFQAGACGVGIGSDIANKSLVEANGFDAIEKAAKRYVEKIATL